MTRFGSVDVNDTIACIIRSAAAFAGTDDHVAMAIAMAESGFDPDAVGDAGCSIGLFQLNTCGGQGDDYRDNRAALKNPWLNASIGIIAIARAVFRYKDRGLTPDVYIREVARHSGHPGFVPLDDRRLIAIMDAYFRLLFHPTRGLIAWPPNDAGNCREAAGPPAPPPPPSPPPLTPPPPPLGSWSEGPAPRDNAQADEAIKRHLDRVGELVDAF